MTAETWARLMALFDRTADLGRDEQRAFLDDLRQQSPDLVEPLSKLLRFDRDGRDGSPSPIRRAIEAVATDLEGAATPMPAGTRVGPYAIERELGRGGMGIVYAAVRVDDDFRKRVALKIASQGLRSPDAMNRFRHERQLLAELEHPHIARLLDGGAMPDGTPYFAMEYVEGVPIDRFCRDRGLPIRARLELFRAVCRAVSYAHEHLVIHRDIKPANILVDASGTPHLLDFGIAKLLDPGVAAGGLTQTSLLPVTPDYCSPEQISGLPVTTRTDVYLLGLLLYELLTGERALRIDSSSPAALAASMASAAAPVASTTASARGDAALARQLRGDLDVIVSTATRREAERRYDSVAALDEDIAAHLRGRPIHSRPESVPYRVRKFLRRNALASAAVAAVLLAIVGGSLATAYQARQASQRAEQVRGLANSLIFSVYDSIANLPGSVAAQNEVVSTALKYLEVLSSNAASDPSLAIDLARGYNRVALIQGSMLRASLDKGQAAEESLAKARSYVEPLVASGRGGDEALAALAEGNTQRALLLFNHGESDAARRLFEQTLTAADQAARQSQASLSIRRQAALTRAEYSRYFRGEDAEQRRNTAARLIESTALLEPVTADTDPELLLEFVGLHSVAIDQLLRTPHEAEAVPLADKVVQLLQQLVARNENHSSARRALGTLSGMRAELLRRLPALNRGDDSRASFVEMVKQAEWLYRSDPSSQASRRSLAIGLVRFADSKPDDDTSAFADFERGLSLLREIAGADPKNVDARYRLTEALTFLSLRHGRRNDLTAAEKTLREALEQSEAMYQLDANRSGTMLTVLMELGRLHAVRKERAQIARIVARVDEVAPPLWKERVEAWKKELSSPDVKMRPRL